MRHTEAVLESQGQRGQGKGPAKGLQMWSVFLPVRFAMQIFARFAMQIFACSFCLPFPFLLATSVIVF